MRCPHCGQPLERGLDVCLFCGARTPPAPKPGAAVSHAAGAVPGVRMVDGVIQPLRPYEADAEREQQRIRERLAHPEGMGSAAPRPPGPIGSIPGLRRVDGVIQPLRPYQDNAPAEPPSPPPPPEGAAFPRQLPGSVPVFQPPQRRQARPGTIPGVRMVDGVIQPLRPYQGGGSEAHDPAAAPDRPEKLLHDLPFPPPQKPPPRQNGQIPGLRRVDGVIQPLRPYQGMEGSGAAPLGEERPEEVLHDLPFSPLPQKPPPRQNGQIPGVKMVEGVIQPLRPYQGMDPGGGGPPGRDLPEEVLHGLSFSPPLKPPPPFPAPPPPRVRESDAGLQRIGGVIQPLRPYQEDAPAPPKPPPWEDWEHLPH